MMTPQELSDAFVIHYGEMINDLRSLAEAEKQHGDAKQTLLFLKQDILLNADDPKSLGANEAARNAKIDTLCTAEAAVVKLTESNVISARNIVEQRRLLIDNTRYQLRCAELAAGISRDKAL